MIPAKKRRDKKKYEPFYAEIVELSRKKQITLLAARKELIRKATRHK